MKTLHIIKPIISLLLAMLFLSCISKQKGLTEAVPVKTHPKLLFLNYTINRMNTETMISLINQIQADGKLKIKPIEKHNSIGDLEYHILDKDFTLLEEYSIKDPLKKTVEFINDSGNLEKKILDLDSAQFSIKLQLPPKANYIVINEIKASGIKQLDTVKIK
ncbi:hypothetical protein [Winogradskyella sp. PC D3.3]